MLLEPIQMLGEDKAHHRLKIYLLDLLVLEHIVQYLSCHLHHSRPSWVLIHCCELILETQVMSTYPPEHHLGRNSREVADSKQPSYFNFYHFRSITSVSYNIWAVFLAFSIPPAIVSEVTAF